MICNFHISRWRIHSVKTIERIKAYEAAGADIIFPESMKDEKEFENVRNLINENVKKISNTISLLTNDLNIEMSDCFVMGFSQGGIMAFELGQSLNKKLAGIAIISSRIISREFVISS